MNHHTHPRQGDETGNERSLDRFGTGRAHGLYEESGLYWCALTLTSRAPDHDTDRTRRPHQSHRRAALSPHRHAVWTRRQLRAANLAIVGGAIGIAVLVAMFSLDLRASSVPEPVALAALAHGG